MDGSEILNAFYYKKLNDENLENQLQKCNEFINNELKDIIENSFKTGFDEGEKTARADENLMVRGKIVGKLFVNTELNDEEIYVIVGLDEEKWREHIKYFRGQFEDGKRSSMMKFLIGEITDKFGALPEKTKKDFEGMDYSILNKKFATAESLEELIEKLGLNVK
ncbi:hypothetical protein [Clostridium tagluense]|uniref:hypothetical protein n=1 Tax=Clostridium tagluense TaxID=360422 RepID=UPI001CF3EE04|nr:hypothetical protein [Clostridium tagluense]MCB2299895.1 hypothetical protein [Clostridium tagluense]